MGVVWIDSQSENVLHVMTTTAGAGTILSDLAALSNAAPSFQWEGDIVDLSPAPVVATYPSVRVTARLFFTDAATGSIATLYIPAPKPSILLPDGVTVDPSAITTLITDCIGNLVAGSGNTVTMFTGGQLWQQRISGIASLQVFP